MAELCNAGEYKQFNYTGNTQSIELLPGRYKLECYGASGGIGNGNINPVGKGGYASGELFIPTLMTLYVHVGQNGVDNWATSVRYNGGGAAINVGGHNGGAGGGATDFRLSNAAWNNVESLKTRILVAGGGGGAQSNCGNTATAGHGGNLIGGTSYNQGYQGRPASTAATRAYSKGGTQTSGGTAYNVNDNNNSSIASGSFGSGANSVQCGAGGGGGWYGGASGYTSGGGGGSSYAAGYPECDTTYQSNQNNIVLENVVFTQGINTGNGYAIITLLEPAELHSVNIINGYLEVDRQYAATEKVNIHFDYPSSTKLFAYWYSKQVFINNVNAKSTFFIMPDEDVTIEAILVNNRLNTNIYKNIFPEEPFDMSYIADTMDNTITTTNDIKQESHNLSIYDVVYLDTDGKYKKAIAENSKRGFPVGVVSGIPSPHVFTLITTGLVQYDRVYTYDDTSILYLSDKEPGKLVHYEEIDNTIYIPIAVYTNQGIIVNILQGSIGNKMLPYEQTVQTFEPYSLYEINQLIVQVKEGVIDDG